MITLLIKLSALLFFSKRTLFLLKYTEKCSNQWIFTQLILVFLLFLSISFQVLCYILLYALHPWHFWVVLKCCDLKDLIYDLLLSLPYTLYLGIIYVYDYMSMIEFIIPPKLSLFRISYSVNCNTGYPASQIPNQEILPNYSYIKLITTNLPFNCLVGASDCKYLKFIFPFKLTLLLCLGASYIPTQ